MLLAILLQYLRKVTWGMSYLFATVRQGPLSISTSLTAIFMTSFGVDPRWVLRLYLRMFVYIEW